jgi:hypothetical protein
MGLGDLTPDQEDDGTSRGKSTHIKFWNPRLAEVGGDIPDDNEHLHQQEFYDAAKRLREMYGPSINVPVGRFLVAAVEAEENDNTEPLEELFEQISQ